MKWFTVQTLVETTFCVFFSFEHQPHNNRTYTHGHFVFFFPLFRSLRESKEIGNAVIFFFLSLKKYFFFSHTERTFTTISRKIFTLTPMDGFDRSIVLIHIHTHKQKKTHRPRPKR